MNKHNRLERRLDVLRLIRNLFNFLFDWKMWTRLGTSAKITIDTVFQQWRYRCRCRSTLEHSFFFHIDPSEATKESARIEHSCRCHLFWNVRMSFGCVGSRFERKICDGHWTVFRVKRNLEYDAHLSRSHFWLCDEGEWTMLTRGSRSDGFFSRM